VITKWQTEQIWSGLLLNFTILTTIKTLEGSVASYLGSHTLADFYKSLYAFLLGKLLEYWVSSNTTLRALLFVGYTTGFFNLYCVGTSWVRMLKRQAFMNAAFRNRIEEETSYSLEAWAKNFAVLKVEHYHFVITTFIRI
jgi:hypothetical protein